MSEWKWKFGPDVTEFRPKGPFKDRTDFKYGSLTCLYPTRRIPKHVFWMCKCNCGNYIEVTASGLQGGHTTSCGCRRIGETNPRWSGYREISGSFLKNLTNNAANRDLNFDVDLEYLWDLFIKQNRRCALSGVVIVFKGKNGNETTASLDRIDSTIGYTPENIQWVHKDINRIKMALTQTEFINLCKLVAEYNK